MKTIGELPDRLKLIDLSQDMEHIRDYLDADLSRYECFFVDTNANGYTEIWGVHSNIPYLEYTAYRIL